MKKGAILFLIFGIFLIGISSAIPYILFVNPTPSDNYETTSNSFEINSSITNLSGFEEFIFNWDGINYTFYNDSLILMMNFENNSGLGENDSFVRDLSKYENNGTVFGAIFNLAGKYNGAYNFSGRNKITIANSASLNITDNLTISLWAKRNNVLVKQISTGKSHICILTEKGDIYCIGYNGYGQLGTGDTINSLSPKLVLGGLNFTTITAGDYHVCALNTTGSAFCWGYNGYGQLGIGNITQMLTPQLILGGYNFTTISAGASHTCALNTTGSAFCWGYNGYGQLGIGNITQMLTPQLILGGYNFTTISAGASHTCALNTTGSAFCWGYNGYGELGIGNTTNMYLPQIVLGELNFTIIIARASHTCALNTTGSAFCWGYNVFRQLGADVSNILDVVKMKNPQLVLGGNNFTSISLGFYYSCGKTNDNEVYCWGFNDYGQLGTGFTEIISPKSVLGSYNFTTISSGMRSTCATTTNHSAFCWGENFVGQLGVGNITNMPSPQLITGMEISSISGGFYHTCALNTTGSAFCWGYNAVGQLGIGNITQMLTPQLILGEYNFTTISAGYDFTCALNTTGSAFCWGYNGYGELGIGNTTSPMKTPQLVLGNINFSSISTKGGDHTCGINTTGSAFCWGYNGYGELGIGNTTSMSTPQLVLGGLNFTSISEGIESTCGIITNGNVYCWGRNDYGELGIGNTTNMNTPQLVLGGLNFTSISLGIEYFTHTCAITTNHSVYCWGYNIYGQLGLGNTTSPMLTPQLVSSENNFSSISLGLMHTCALNTTGSAFCWGNNVDGELGNGKTSVIFPNYKAIKSVLIGKSADSFLIGETFGGTIVSILNQNPVEFGTPSGWVNILLSYNQTADLYLNGTLVNNSAYIQIDSDPSVITIGENFDGTIDEIRILNRTVLASEVQQFYKSNLKKINETSWEFYSNQSLDSEKTYSYFLFAKDSVSSYRLLRNIIKFPFSEEDLFSDSSSGIFKPTQKQLKEGYVKILTKKQKVQVNLSNGEQYLAEIKEVNKILEKVVVSIGGNNYSIAKNSSEKIDLNNDGYYDLQVSVTQIYITGYAKVEFKEIHEEISQENKESVTESAVDNNENIAGDKYKIIYYILGGIIIFGIILYFVWFKRNRRLF